MIVNSGLNLMRDLMSGAAPNPPSHIAVGTGTTAVAAGDTALETEVERFAFAAKTGTGNGIFEYTGVLPSTDGNGNDLAEVGVLNATASGDLVLRKTHNSFPKTADFSVKYVIRHTITNV